MANYSKEFNEELGDFSILDEFDRLEPNQKVNTMCEGFGFVALSKNLNGDKLVGFKNFRNDEMKWILFEKLTVHTYKTIWKK